MQREDYIDIAIFALIIFLPMDEVAIAEIGEKYGAFRIVNPRADLAMLKSMQRHGQISPVVCTWSGGGYEMIDGFKRLRASRKLNRLVLKTKKVELSDRASKAAIIQLNRSGRSITEMEEALVMRSLHRQDGLTQVEISVLLGRHKSWVSRRLSLIERLSEDIQDDIRLGLLSASAGRELAKLPRGNQRAAADAVLKHRFSIREVEKLITHLLSRPNWEHKTILSAPWEIIEPKQPRPVGLAAKLISFERLCRSLVSDIKRSELGKRNDLYESIERAIAGAQEVIKALMAGSAAVP